MQNDFDDYICQFCGKICQPTADPKTHPTWVVGCELGRSWHGNKCPDCGAKDAKPLYLGRNPIDTAFMERFKFIDEFGIDGNPSA